ncbi:Uncharacterised protein [Vibrio cholerae]|nr:Uncharacterised protein [Vibrio cholerae]
MAMARCSRMILRTLTKRPSHHESLIMRMMSLDAERWVCF